MAERSIFDAYVRGLSAEWTRTRATVTGPTQPLQWASSSSPGIYPRAAVGCRPRSSFITKLAYLSFSHHPINTSISINPGRCKSADPLIGRHSARQAHDPDLANYLLNLHQPSGDGWFIDAHYSSPGCRRHERCGSVHEFSTSKRMTRTMLNDVGEAVR